MKLEVKEFDSLYFYRINFYLPLRWQRELISVITFLNLEMNKNLTRG